MGLKATTKKHTPENFHHKYGYWLEKLQFCFGFHYFYKKNLLWKWFWKYSNMWFPH